MNKFCSILLCLLLVLHLGGCQTLRKKFTRKKKYKKEQPVYVDFKEYPSTTTPELYTDYFLFTVGWLDEVIANLTTGYNSRRMRRALEETERNLNHINDSFDEEGKKELAPLYEEFLALKKRLLSRVSSGQRSRLAREVEILQLRFRKKFKYSLASQWIL